MQVHLPSLQALHEFKFVQGSLRSAIVAPKFVQGSSRLAMALQPPIELSTMSSLLIAQLPEPEAIDYDLTDNNSIPSDEDGINLKELKSLIAKQ